MSEVNMEMSIKINEFNININRKLMEYKDNGHELMKALYALHLHIFLISLTFALKDLPKERNVLTWESGEIFREIDEIIDDGVSDGIPGDLMVSSLIMFQNKIIAMISNLGNELQKAFDNMVEH